ALEGLTLDRAMKQAFVETDGAAGPPPSTGYAAIVLESWNVLYVEDTSEGRLAGDLDRARAGWRSSLVVPLVAQHQLEAVLVLASAQEAAFSAEQRAMAQQLGPMLAGAFLALVASGAQELSNPRAMWAKR